MTHPTDTSKVTDSAVAAFVASLDIGWNEPEPPDGSMICVAERAVYVRTDQPEPRGFYYNRYPHEEPGERAGDWWLLDGTEDGKGPFSIQEILGYDEPPEDRKVLSFELLYTPGDLARIASPAPVEGGESR